MRTYGELRLMSERWRVAALEPHVAIKFKAIFTKVPRNSPGPFHLPANDVTAEDLLWFMDRYPLAVADADRARLDADRAQYRGKVAEVGRIMAPDYVPRDFKGLRAGQTVRPHQARAAELLARFGGLLVADDMGEGKTYTGGAACLLPGALPATVVCPTHLKLQWQRKLREFTTLTTHVVKGTKPYALPPVDVRIFTYSNLAGWVDFLPMMGTGLAIFDESHSLRGGTHRGTDEIAKGVAADKLAEVARMRLGLTGTPVFNYGEEIWNVMRFLRPEVLGEYADFSREWCSGRSVKDPDALGAYLREQHAMIRKTGAAPPANVLVETIDHDVRRLDSVREMAEALAYKARHGSFTETGQAIRELDLLLRMQTGIAKAPAAARFVRMIAEDRPVILGGWHRDVYDIWLRDLADLNPVLYTGTESPTQKAESVRAFLAGESKVFIISLRSGEGLDGLQAVCRTVVIGELDWSPAVHAQLIARANREGQACWPDRVDAIYLVAEDGSDPAMMDVLGLKSSQASGIVDPGLGPQQVRRDRSPLEALIERYLTKDAAAMERRA